MSQHTRRSPALPFRARRGLALTAAVAATVLLAACASSKSADTAQTTPSAGASGGTTVGAPSGALVTDYPAYVGGKAGAADKSLTPIKIGWINNQGATLDLPSATEGAQAAVNYVNAELGGIGGHPLELSTCFIASAEEEGTRCGQQMVNDKAISIVDYGAVLIGNQALQGTIGGLKPIMVTVGTAIDAVGKDTYLLNGDQTHVLSPFGTYARDVLHAKTAAVVFANLAGANGSAEAAKKGLEAAGVKVKSVGYDPTATDLLGPLTAAGGQTADVIVSMTDIPGCANLAKALQQIGNTKPVMSAPTCLSPQVASALGGDLPKWTYGLGQTLALDSSAEDAKVFVATSTKYGVKKANLGNPYTELGWVELIVTAKLMNQVGADKITPETMNAAIKAFTGPLVLGGPSVQCGKYPSAAGVCGDQAKFYSYLGKGQFKSVSGWLSPP